MVTVLVVDDSAVDRKMAGGLLAKGGDWEIQYACDGADALRTMQAVRPDLVVTDLQMPNLNGLELVQLAKEQFPLVPVVLMTGQGSETIAVQALQQGAASYVPKHSLRDDLVETIGRVLSLAGEMANKKALLGKMTAFASSFILPNDPALLSSLVKYVQSILVDLDVLPESDRLRTGVALEEALLNASYHGNLEVSSKLRESNHAQYYELARRRAGEDPYQRRSIYVDIRIDARGLEYCIRDEGPGFDPESLPDPTDPANLERPCGRGVLLMRTFMDEVQYNERGNQVIMTKRAKEPTAAS
ncbi:MAG: ATP-binding protein [Planctomycetaceae bacterium]|nr:ATP-binding protein [Planctomycetaceae bacterium]